jgi:thioredoxin-like negative regulator of GroEL
VRETAEADIREIVDSVKLASGVITAEQVLIDRFNEAYDHMQAGRYNSAITAYTDLLASSGPVYELTCLTNLVNCHMHTKSYAQAEYYYLQLTSLYPQETCSNPEVQAACQLVQSIINSFKSDAKKYDKYLGLKAGIYEKNATNESDFKTRLKLAALDFEYDFYTQAFDQVLSVIEDENTLEGQGYEAFREMVDVLGAEDDYVKIARQKLERIRIKLRL